MVASCILDSWNGLQAADKVFKVCWVNFAVLGRGTVQILFTIFVNHFLLLVRNLNVKLVKFFLVLYIRTMVFVLVKIEIVYSRYRKITLLKMAKTSFLKLKISGGLGRCKYFKRFKTNKLR